MFDELMNGIPTVTGQASSGWEDGARAALGVFIFSIGDLENYQEVPKHMVQCEAPQ